MRICQTIPESDSMVQVATCEADDAPQTGFGAWFRRRIKRGDVKFCECSWRWAVNEQTNDEDQGRFQKAADEELL